VCGLLYAAIVRRRSLLWVYLILSFAVGRSSWPTHLYA